MTADYRALCAELLNRLNGLYEEILDAGVGCVPDEAQDLMNRAWEAMAQPEPEGPTDENLTQHLFEGFSGPIEFLCDAEEDTHLMIRSHVKFARAVLARWGRPTPQPADGEVAELVAWMRDRGQERETLHLPGTNLSGELRTAPFLLTRAADLLERLSPPLPTPVSERLPEPSVKVLAHYFNALGKGRTICAIWVPAKSRSDEGDLDADDFLEYDEENDKYHWPEGWYEAIENWEELGWAKVYEGEIVYWQPLPQWPSNALPTPETTND